MITENGRPADARQRLPRERRVYDFLDSLHIPYFRADHDPAMTMEACLHIEAVLGAPVCKNLLLCNRQNTAFYLLLLPGDKPFRTSVLSGEIGSSRLSFAGASLMEELLDTSPGSLSVLSLMNDREGRVQLLIDEEVLREPHFCCHPCKNTSTLRLSTEDLTEKIIPQLHHIPRFVTL